MACSDSRTARSGVQGAVTELDAVEVDIVIEISGRRSDVDDGVASISCRGRPPARLNYHFAGISRATSLASERAGASFLRDGGDWGGIPSGWSPFPASAAAAGWFADVELGLAGWAAGRAARVLIDAAVERRSKQASWR